MKNEEILKKEIFKIELKGIKNRYNLIIAALFLDSFTFEGYNERITVKKVDRETFLEGE